MFPPSTPTSTTSRKSADRPSAQCPWTRHGSGGVGVQSPALLFTNRGQSTRAVIVTVPRILMTRRLFLSRLHAKTADIARAVLARPI